MMLFHSDSDQIGISVDYHAVTIAVNDRAYVIDMTAKQRVDLGVMLMKTAEARHRHETENPKTNEEGL